MEIRDSKYIRVEMARESKRGGGASKEIPEIRW